MIGVAPFSWRFGVIRHTHYKIVFALGPLRLALHDVAERRTDPNQSEMF